MKLFKSFVLSFSLLMISAMSFGEVVLSVHKDNPVQLTKEQIVNIYMGRLDGFPNGGAVLPVDQAGRSSVYRKFYKTYLSRSPSQMKAFWASAVFTGRGEPPLVRSTGKSVVEFVAADINAIGYVDARHVNDSVRVIKLK